LLDYKNDWDERQAISASMQISLDSLKRRNKNSLNLLKLFAYFEPESIPPVRGWKRHNESSQLREEKKKTQAGCLSMFSCFGSGDSHTAVPMQSMGRINSGFQASSESVHMILKDDPSLDDALSQLRDFSLIKALPESHKFWMHDLTRYFVQQSIPVGENVNWLCLALEVLFHTFPERDGTVEERTIVDVFLPQAESLIVQARNAGIPLQKYAKLISICGVCFHDRFSYAKALEMFEIARPIYEKQLGMKNEKTLTLLHRIGWCHRERGDLSLSEKYYSQTLASRRKILPPDSLDLFISMSDLASVIERQGRLKEAEVLFEKCYESQKLALGSSHRRTLAAAHNLALCYANQGRVAAGERVCQTTLKLSKEHYGDDDPGTLRTASNLAVFIDHQGRLAEALPIYEESLKGYKRRYGYNHVLTMRVRSNLAGIWRLEGKFKEAEAMLREVMSELIRLLGHDHVHVCIAQFDLAEILHEEGKVEEAQDRYSKAITIFEFSDPKHPVLFRMVDGLGILYREMGNLVQADTMTERAYNENMNLLKWHDPYTLMSAHSRAEVFQLNGRLDDAQKLFEKCLESFSSLLGQAHPHIFMTRNSLGCLELRKRKFDRAIRHFEAAKTGYSAFVGEKHVCVMIIQINLSRAQLELGKLDLATTSVQSAKDGLITVLGSEHPHVAVAEFYLGLIAARQGDLQGARSHYLRSIELYKLSLGDTHPNCIRAAIELLKVLAQLNGEEDECVTWLSTINDTMPALHEMGCIESKPKALTMEDFKNPVGSTGNWSASDGLPWGESARLRWGRKSVWREADEGTLTG
jgi:tetratricopeptide (TPR) repeat protein